MNRTTVLFRILSYLLSSNPSFNSRLIIIVCFTLNYLNGIHRTGRKTIPQTITVIIFDKSCFTINHCDCILMARIGTRTTTITLFLVYMNYLAYHINPHFCTHFFAYQVCVKCAQTQILCVKNLAYMDFSHFFPFLKHNN